MFGLASVVSGGHCRRICSAACIYVTIVDAYVA
jgi:hypothetical protein